jgi:uncharacterized protein involved in exopolysaccharide biosynthesis
MNPRFRQTFERHRVLFALPLVLTTFLAVWYVLGSPKTYESSASLWVDTPAPQASSLGESNAYAVTPGASAQMLLNELLTTRDFRVEVARRGPLAQYIADHSTSGWGPGVLVDWLRSTPTTDSRVISSLDTKHVLTTVAGPQVLAISVKGPSPSVAAGTLRALLATFEEQRNTYNVERARASVAYYENKARAAAGSLESAKKELADYLAAHPGASISASGGVPADVQLRALTEAQRVAASQYSAANKAANQAEVSLNATASDKSTFQILDHPNLPTGPVSGKAKALMGVIGGLFVGALISLLAIVAVSSRTEPATVAEPAEPVPAARAVAAADADDGGEATHRVAAVKRTRAAPSRTQVTAREKAGSAEKTAGASAKSPARGKTA